MKKLLTFLLGLTLFANAQAEVPSEKVVLLIGTSPAAQIKAHSTGERLRELGIEPVLISQDSAEGKSFGGTPEVSYLLRQVEGQVVWQDTLEDEEAALQKFQNRRYQVPDGKLLTWVRRYPEASEGKMKQYDLVELYAGGLPGLKLAATIGGQQVPMEEQRAGFYSGGYRVKAEDRSVAAIKLVATAPDGFLDERELGSLTLEGMSAPQVTGIGQIGLSDWQIDGQADPGARVRIDVAIRIGGLFGTRTKRRSVETYADSEGNFSTVARLGSLTSSPRGTVRASSINDNGVEAPGPEQQVRFRSRVRVRPGFYNGLWGPGPFRRGFLGPFCR